jgi:hypothetical protein
MDRYIGDLTDMLDISAAPNIISCCSAVERFNSLVDRVGSSHAVRGSEPCDISLNHIGQRALLVVLAFS